MTGIPISMWGVTVEQSDEEIGKMVRQLIAHGYEVVVVKPDEAVSEPVDFSKARPGETTYVYDVEHLGWDYSWVTDIEFFEEMDNEDDITVKRQLWQLVSEDEVTFPGWASRHEENVDE